MRGYPPLTNDTFFPTLQQQQQLLLQTLRRGSPKTIYQVSALKILTNCAQEENEKSGRLTKLCNKQQHLLILFFHHFHCVVTVALLVSRGGCSFELKARNAMLIPEVAFVIIYDDHNQSHLVPMSATDAHGITVRLLFVSSTTGACE